MLAREPSRSRDTQNGYGAAASRPPQVLTVMFAMLMGAMSLGLGGPSIGAVGRAQAVAARIYEVNHPHPRLASLNHAHIHRRDRFPAESSGR